MYIPVAAADEMKEEVDVDDGDILRESMPLVILLLPSCVTRRSYFSFSSVIYNALEKIDQFGSYIDINIWIH